MISIRSIVAGAALLVAGASMATAADLNGYSGGSMKDGGGYMPAIQAQPSWYLRIDGAYARHDDPSMVENGIWDLTETSLGNSWSVGGGIGRYIGKNARIEFTYDRRFEMDAQGNLADNNAPLRGVRRFGIESDLFLGSIYYDFDATRGFRPYIGIGLGTVRHSTTAGTVTGVCRCDGEIDGATNWHVAGALMAGFSYQMRDRLHFDAGYRFLYLGEAKTGAVRAINGGPTVSDDPDVKEIHAHEVRFGLRYDIW